MSKCRSFFAAVLCMGLLLGMVSCNDSSYPDDVIQNEIRNYNLALKSGDMAEVCAEAMLIAEMYKQANDEKNYLYWKQIAQEAERKSMQDTMDEVNKMMNQHWCPVNSFLRFF